MRINKQPGGLGGLIRIGPVSKDCFQMRLKSTTLTLWPGTVFVRDLGFVGSDSIPHEDTTERTLQRL